MTEHTESHAAVASITQALRVHWRRWLIPAALTTVLCTCYATVIYQPPWEVTQALTVRDEAASGTVRPGSFDTPETLKNYQETILELITSPSVVSAALQQVGPPSGSHGGNQWPTPIDIDKARGKIRIVPPNGTELGTTELFYLKVEDTDRQRALKLTGTLCQQLERRFQQLRNRKTQSVIDELSQTVELAKAKLDTSVNELSQIEQSVGVDLVELRALSDRASGTGSLQTTIAELRQELRRAAAKLETDQHLLELLRAAREDPDHLVATPNRLLEALPALKRLKDGLIDTQLQTSQLLGTLSPEHPRVRAALVAEKEIRDHLHHELDVAVRGLQAEVILSSAQAASLNKRLDDAEQRMRRLVSIRASYAALIANVLRRTENLTTTQHDLTAAMARSAAAKSTSLITQVDGPETGAYPNGPRRSIIILAGIGGGLFIGFGIVFLTVVPVPARPARQDTTPQSTISTPRRPPTWRPVPQIAFNDTCGKQDLSLTQALARVATEEPTPQPIAVK